MESAHATDFGSAARVVTVPLTLSNLDAFKRQMRARGTEGAPKSKPPLPLPGLAELPEEAPARATGHTAVLRLPTPTASTAAFRARLDEKAWSDVDDHAFTVSPSRTGRAGDASTLRRVSSAGLVEVSGRAGTPSPPPPSGLHAADTTVCVRSATVQAPREARRGSGGPVSCSVRACTPPRPPPPLTHGSADGAPMERDSGMDADDRTPPRPSRPSPHVRATALCSVIMSPAPRVPWVRGGSAPPPAEEAEEKEDDEVRRRRDTTDARAAVLSPFARGPSPRLAMYYLPPPSPSPPPALTGQEPPSAELALTARSPQKPVPERAHSLTPSRWAPALSTTRPTSTAPGAPLVSLREHSPGTAVTGGGEARVTDPTLTPLRMSTLTGHTWDIAMDLDRCTAAGLVAHVAAQLGFPPAQVQLKHVATGWTAALGAVPPDHTTALSTVAPFVKAHDVFLVILASAAPTTTTSPAGTTATPAMTGSRAAMSRNGTRTTRRSTASSPSRPRKSRRTDAPVVGVGVDEALRSAKGGRTADLEEVSAARASARHVTGPPPPLRVLNDSPRNRGVPPPLVPQRSDTRLAPSGPKS